MLTSTGRARDPVKEEAGWRGWRDYARGGGGGGGSLCCQASAQVHCNCTVLHCSWSVRTTTPRTWTCACACSLPSRADLIYVTPAAALSRVFPIVLFQHIFHPPDPTLTNHYGASKLVLSCHPFLVVSTPRSILSSNSHSTWCCRHITTPSPHSFVTTPRQTANNGWPTRRFAARQRQQQQQQQQ